IKVIDTTPPTLSTPLDSVLNVSCGDVPDVPELVFVDNCSAIVNPPVFTTVTINQTDYTYTIVRTWVVSDTCGNSDEFTQTINVSINEPFSYVNASLCTTEGEKDLFDLLDPNIETNGTWLDVNNSGGLSGSILDPINIPSGFYVYRYTIPNGNCPRIIEVYMTIDNCFVLGCDISKLKISKVVTPNNDGHNDFFEIGGIEDCRFIYEVKMFNRWGALVYENNNYKNNWDGIANGAISNSNLPSGTYYYIVNIVDSGFDTFKGYIYLGTKN
ncbi:gliding motility-associated C-terminal domain-containing protein, partial [Flavobacterium swingsii]